MYVRMVLGSLRPGTWNQYERHYNERVVPSTEGTQGLRERKLLRSTEDPDQGISLSVWETLEDLRNYEISQTRRDLVQEIEPIYLPWAYPRGEYLVKHFEIISTTRFQPDKTLIGV